MWGPTEKRCFAESPGLGLRALDRVLTVILDELYDLIKSLLTKTSVTLFKNSGIGVGHLEGFFFLFVFLFFFSKNLKTQL